MFFILHDLPSFVHLHVIIFGWKPEGLEVRQP